MNWPFIRFYGLRFSVLAAGLTVGIAYLAAERTGTSPELVALGLIGLAGIVLVLVMGTTDASTAAASNQPGQTTLATVEDAGAGRTPPGGVRPLFFALGLFGWSALLLVLRSRGLV